MDLHLNNKRVLITGASKGIGLACAKRLVKEGCSVRLVARGQEALDAAQQIIEKDTGVKVEIFSADLSDTGAVQALMANNRDIDILINNAGAIPGGDILQVDDDTWRTAWDLKVFGYVNMCREAYSAMAERKSGVIINIIGAGGERPTPSYIVGSAGNAALMALTRALGSSSTRKGVRVVGVNPGLIKTERLTTQLGFVAKQKFDDETRWMELLDSDYPPGEPENIADMTAFLVSDLSAFTTGTIVTVDGGASMRFR